MIVGYVDMVKIVYGWIVGKKVKWGMRNGWRKVLDMIGGLLVVSLLYFVVVCLYYIFMVCMDEV